MFYESKKRLRTALGVCGLVLLGACASMSSIDKEPRVSLVNLQPTEFQLLEQRYVATIRIQNPNPVALAVQGLDYTLSINGAQFADGVSNQHVTIPAYGETTLELGLTSTFVNLLDQFRRLGEAGGKVTYGIAGTLGIEGVLNGIDFQRDGEIDLNLARPPQERAA